MVTTAGPMAVQDTSSRDSGTGATHLHLAIVSHCSMVLEATPLVTYMMVRIYFVYQ